MRTAASTSVEVYGVGGSCVLLPLVPTRVFLSDAVFVSQYFCSLTTIDSKLLKFYLARAASAEGVRVSCELLVILLPKKILQTFCVSNSPSTVDTLARG